MTNASEYEPNEGLNRRELLRKALIAGGAVAAGSVVTSVVLPQAASAFTHTLFRAKFVRNPVTHQFVFTAPEGPSSPPIPQLADEWAASTPGSPGDAIVTPAGGGGRGVTIQLTGANKFIVDPPFVVNPLIAVEIVTNPGNTTTRQGANAPAGGTTASVAPPRSGNSFIRTVWFVYGTS
jgi:hypothetical protein